MMKSLALGEVSPCFVLCIPIPTLPFEIIVNLILERIMKKMILVMVLLFVGNMVNAACPSADLTDDCEINLEDFAVIASGWLTTYVDTDLLNIASEWLTQGVPEDPAKMAWVTINDPGVSGHEVFNGEMSKYETTNAQYCQFLNAALASGDITVTNDIVYGANGTNSGADFAGDIYFDTYEKDSDSQISFDGYIFSIRTRKDTSNNDIDMSNHPVVEVSWYGATAFCNYYGYRLPTEWEWQAVADYDGSYTYGCGTTIDSGKANYDSNNPLGLSSIPYTSPVNYLDSYGYGMNDMAGNAWEWVSSASKKVICGGSWHSYEKRFCDVSFRDSDNPPAETYTNVGFRVCR